MQGLKDCLRINWAWKQKPYSLTEVLIRSNFSKMIWTNKTKFIFRLGNYTMNVLYLALSKSFALNISSRDMKTQPWDIFARKRITKCVVGCNHDGSLENHYCVPFFKLKFLIHTLCHIFYSTKSSNIYEESDFISSVSVNNLGKYTFFVV